MFIRPTDGIRVQVAAVDLTTPEQVIYSYKLDGADKDWVHLGHQASISIPPQRPGRYTLRIRSTNGAGLEVDNEKDFTIVVRRRFLQSGWAGILYLLLAGAAVWLLTRRRATSFFRSPTLPLSVVVLPCRVKAIVSMPPAVRVKRRSEG